MSQTPVTMKMIEICNNLQPTQPTQARTSFRYVALDVEKGAYGSVDVPKSGRYVDCDKIINHTDDLVGRAKSALNLYNLAMDNLSVVKVDVLNSPIRTSVKSRTGTTQPSATSRQFPPQQNETSSQFATFSQFQPQRKATSSQFQPQRSATSRQFRSNDVPYY